MDDQDDREGEERDLVLSGTAWRAVEPDELRGAGVTMLFDDESVWGFAGCNRFRGRYDFFEGWRFTVHAMAGTRMAGTPEAMEAERMFLQRLSEASRLDWLPEEIVVTDREPTWTMLFVRDWDHDPADQPPRSRGRER